MEEFNLQPLEQSRDLVLSQVQSITVTDEASEAQAASWLVTVRVKLKEYEKDRKSWTDPIEQHKKRIIAEFKKLTEPLEAIESKLNMALTQYRNRVEQERIKRESQLQAREDKKFDRQVEKGNIPSIPEPLQVHIESQPKTGITDDGKITYSESWKADFDHAKLEDVPKSINGVPILTIDRVAVNKLVTAGIRNIPGIPIVKVTQTRIGK